MTSTKTRTELRHELAHDFVRSNECEVMDLYQSHEDTYKAGFDAADANPPQYVQDLVKALELYEHAPRIKMVPHADGHFEEVHIWPAAEALAAYHAAIKGVNRDSK